jgi:predicted HTH domain antitoxin
MTDLAISTAAPVAALTTTPLMPTPASPLVISPDFLRLLGKSEQEVKIELAVFFFTSHYLSTGQAARFAGMSRVEFWEELGKRKIPIFDCDEETLRQDLEALRKFNEKFPVKANDRRQ